MKRLGILLAVAAFAVACTPPSPPTDTTTTTTPLTSPDPALNVTLLAEGGSLLGFGQRIVYPSFDASDIARFGMDLKQSGSLCATTLVARVFGVFDVQVGDEVQQLRTLLLSVDGTGVDTGPKFFTDLPVPPTLEVEVRTGFSGTLPCDFRVAVWGTRG